MNPPEILSQNLSLNCYSIPAEKPFLNVLARWILEQYGTDAALLPKLLVLLPNRRACRSLREAFLEVTGGKPILLPRIQPIGDIDEASFLQYQAAMGDLPATISPLRRELLLTRLVMNFMRTQPGAAEGRVYNVEQAAELARKLAAFMDDVAREGLGLDRLSSLVPQELAEHWQQTLDFLKIISHHWPEILRGEGVMDPVEHRNRLLLATAQAWAIVPPAGPVIAAGSTGSMPATAALLAAIARLPQGRVVLPGLDTQLPDAEWDMITETHPQYGLRQLLHVMDCQRSEVQLLVPGRGIASCVPERITCLRAILQPPEATASWAQAQLPIAEGMNGVRLLTADTQFDEARMIAIALRETLETPEKTAALITPDRTLARMVVAQMQRFGIEIDDSAGQPLSDTPPGCFLRLVLDMVASAAAPSPLLALLRHPLAGGGMATADCRQDSREIETALLRGLRREPGLEALNSAAVRKEVSYGAKALLSALAERTRVLADYFRRKKTVPLYDLLKAHMELAEWCASTDAESGAARLWAGEAGNQLAAFLADLLEQGDLLQEVDPVSYPGLFDVLLAGQMYRPRHGLHPRLHILSPIEARLQRFNRVILGSLNEGTWPSPPEADPWMSRPMRASFGLPAAERAIGQSAHDVYLLCASPEVILTRAHKVEGTPTVPSRWLVRLETLVKGLDAPYYGLMRVEKYYDAGRKKLDTPGEVSDIAAPMPKPPVSARPRQLRVTAIDTWLRDPYVIYAQYILKLKKLEPLDEEPDAADFGTLVHKALEQFTRAYPVMLPEHAREALLECGRTAFAKMMDRPAVACLWWPRFEAMASWLVAAEKERRSPLTTVHGELKGRWEFQAGGRAFALTTQIDRLEIAPDGSGLIADYKTGTVPTKADIDRGLANQLFLEALVVMHGTLDPVIAAPNIITGLEYWKLSGREEQCEIKAVDAEGIAGAQARLEGLIRDYDQVAMPYIAQADPSKTLRYNDYDHLTRRQEWEAV